MTIKQKQALLAYLGYYDGRIDGMWGEKSQRAAIDFQRGYMDTVDGIFGAETEKRILDVVVSGEAPKKTMLPDAADWWQDIRYFKRAEFRCPCGKCGGFPAEPEEALVRLADRVRGHFGVPVTVTSGVRCQSHNNALPGSVPNSRHIRGKAMDFIVGGFSASSVVAYVQTLGVHYTYAIDHTAVHMDVA